MRSNHFFWEKSLWYITENFKNLDKILWIVLTNTRSVNLEIYQIFQMWSPPESFFQNISSNWSLTFWYIFKFQMTVSVGLIQSCFRMRHFYHIKSYSQQNYQIKQQYPHWPKNIFQMFQNNCLAKAGRHLTKILFRYLKDNFFANQMWCVARFGTICSI